MEERGGIIGGDREKSIEYVRQGCIIHGGGRKWDAINQLRLNIDDLSRDIDDISRDVESIRQTVENLPLR
jgi:hypothetical protein